MEEDKNKNEELRKLAMSELKKSIKKSHWKLYDIAAYSGNSTSWISSVLNGKYPYYGAYKLPKNVRVSLQQLGFDVPEILWTF